MHFYICIYILIFDPLDQGLANFTVKYEMVTIVDLWPCLPRSQLFSSAILEGKQLQLIHK